MAKDFLDCLPVHLGIIIDGNGRWAKKRGLDRSVGHAKGFANLQKIVKECFYTYNIPIVSIYAFSKENWNRPQKEIDYLMDLFRKYLGKNLEKQYPDVRINFLGNIDGLPKDIADACKKLIKSTSNKQKILNLAINYSGQEEICHAFNEMLKANEQFVNVKTIEKYLYTKGQPPLDFVIRTSGEQRLSNFMLWQVAYAEFCFPKVEWPAFSKKHLYKALLEYQSRDRRFGAIKD